MKKNKDLQKIADESLNEFRNENFKEELFAKRAELYREKSSVQRSAKNKNAALRWAFSAVGTLAIILAVIVPCVLFLSPSPGDTNTPAPPHYGWDDELNTASAIDDVNSVLSGYLLDDEYVQAVSLVVDGKTGDELYYDISWENFEELKGCRIIVIINPYYEPFEKSTNSEMTVAELNIKYSMETEYDAEYGVYAFEGWGETEIGGLRVLFRSYSYLSETNDNGFEDFIESVFLKE